MIGLALLFAGRTQARNTNIELIVEILFKLVCYFVLFILLLIPALHADNSFIYFVY